MKIVTKISFIVAVLLMLTFTDIFSADDVKLEPIRMNEEHKIICSPLQATFTGRPAKVINGLICEWSQDATQINWNIQIPSPGRYQIYLEYAARPDEESRLLLSDGEVSARLRVMRTIGWNDIRIAETTIDFASAGKKILTLKYESRTEKFSTNIGKLILIPIEKVVAPANLVRLNKENELVCTAESAEFTSNRPANVVNGWIKRWVNSFATINWKVEIKTAGDYNVRLVYAANFKGDGKIELSGGDEPVLLEVTQTGGWTKEKTAAAIIHFSTAGIKTLNLRYVERKDKFAVNIAHMILTLSEDNKKSECKNTGAENHVE